MDIFLLLPTFQDNCESAKLIRKENRPQTKKRIQKVAARLKEKRKLCLLTQVFPLIMYY